MFFISIERARERAERQRVAKDFFNFDLSKGVESVLLQEYLFALVFVPLLK